MKKRSFFTLLGFVIFFIGFISLVLALVGLNYSFLSFLEKLPSPFGFVAKLVLMFGGMIMLYIARTYDPDQKEP